MYLHRHVDLTPLSLDSVPHNTAPCYLSRSIPVKLVQATAESNECDGNGFNEGFKEII
jgi:hypothetical protein